MINVETATIKELQEAKYQITLQTKVNDKMKKAIKLFVKNVFELDYLPSTYQLKKLFPGFLASNPIHWFNIIDKCDSMLQEREQVKVKKEIEVMKKVEEIVEKEAESDRERNARHANELRASIKRFSNVFIDKEDYLMGYSAYIYMSYQYGNNRDFKGTVGYNVISQKFYAAMGRYGRPMLFNSMEQALNALLGVKTQQAA